MTVGDAVSERSIDKSLGGQVIYVDDTSTKAGQPTYDSHNNSVG